jgi:hypothetical protein
MKTFITSAIETTTKILKEQLFEHFDQVVSSKVAEAMAVINDGRPNKRKADDDVGYSCSKRFVAAESAQPMEVPRQNFDPQEFSPTRIFTDRILTDRIFTDKNFDRREF